MQVRLEIVEAGPIAQGVISIRGYNKGTVSGCDYLVYLTREGNRMRMFTLTVRRGIVMSKEDCNFLQSFDLSFPKNDTSFTLLKGKWIWANGWADKITLKKTTNTVSQSALEEGLNYHWERYALFEENGVMLSPTKRPGQNAGQVKLDSSQVVVDISSIEKSEHDSISVLLNGEPVAELISLYKQPLRLRFQQLNEGMNIFVIISESKIKKKIPLQLTIRQNSLVKEFTVAPGFVFNSMLLLEQQQE